MRKITIILFSIVLMSSITASAFIVYPIHFQDKETGRSFVVYPVHSQDKETGERYVSDVIIKEDCPRDEWNQNFEDYRAGLIDKSSMKEYVKSCNW